MNIYTHAESLESRVLELEGWLGIFTDGFCNCGYLIPSKIALDPADHDERCIYRLRLDKKPELFAASCDRPAQTL